MRVTKEERTSKKCTPQKGTCRDRIANFNVDKDKWNSFIIQMAIVQTENQTVAYLSTFFFSMCRSFRRYIENRIDKIRYNRYVG